jgi:broad specificity phosphatase PhoE
MTESSLPVAEHYDIARGSSNIPLTPKGRADLCRDGCDLARLCDDIGTGRISKIYTSDLQRTRESGAILQRCLGTCIPIESNANLDPWYQGWIEGQTVSPPILREMQRLQVKDPDETPPGRGPLSTHPGESFNNYKSRFFRTIIPIMEHFRESTLCGCSERIVMVNHYRGIKVLQAWIAAGTPESKVLDNQELLRHDGAPGDIHRLYIDPSGRWKLDMFDATRVQAPLPPGIYVIRHGLTPWNKETNTR